MVMLATLAVTLQPITPVTVATHSMGMVLVSVRLMERGLGVLPHVNVRRICRLINMLYRIYSATPL